MAEIYLIDGSNIIYRSFYAIPELKTSTGHLTNGIFGFTNTLFKLIRERSPEYLAVFFDLKGPTFRHEEFEEYKQKRKPMPEGLSAQIPVVKEILNHLGIKYFEREGYEADDIIASFVRKLSEKKHKIFIVSGDKDIFQLLSENVSIINPATGEVRDTEWFIKKYGISPDKMPDIIGLAGDTSDNIPGIPGIGEKTALKLLKKFNTLEEIYEKEEKITSEKLKEKLLKNKEIAFMSKKLATLDNKIPFDINLQDIKISLPQFEKLIEIFEKYELRKLIQQLHQLYPEFSIEIFDNDTIGFSDGKTVNFSEVKKDPEKYKEIFENPDIKKYGNSLKEKIVFLAHRNIKFESPSFDISIAKYLTGKVITEKNIFKCIEKYKNLMEKEELIYLFENVEMPLVETLAWMEINGIKVDIEYLKILSEKLNEELTILQEKIYSIAGEVFNINSHQQISEILFEKLKLPAKKKTKTGYSTDINVLKELASLHPLPSLLVEYREIHKLKSTYIEGLIPYINKKTGRIHPVFSQTTTVTGRLSCSNPNLQNIPIRSQKGSLIRKGFCVENGNILYSFDYSQIELRILAHFSSDKYLIDAFMKGKDIHQETAEILFPANSLFSPLNFSQLDKKQLRRIAKTINFGIIYGMSVYGLSKELNIPVEEASIFIKNYFEKFKGAKQYIDKTIKEAEEKGYVKTILNRRRYIPEIRSKEKNQREFGKRAAINMPVQGSAADMIKLAMNRIYKFFKEKKLKSKMVLQIHDELLFEIYPDEEKIVCENVKKIMENAIELKVPVKVDVKKGKNFLEMFPL